ncbi:MAG TPA: TlpA disulfide reductase family protein [Gallionellaceae bacterium]|nr:TlpA disulfide reductase family protein [Gallionellaceae bacterium]
MLSAAVMAKAAFAGDQSAQLGTGSSAPVAAQDIRAMMRANTLPPKANNEGKMKPFSLTGLDGVRHSLADWKGKVVILNFWATWCSPCLYEIRDFVTYQEQYKARGLQIIGLGLDDEKKLRNVQRTLEINYPVLVADPVENSGLMKLWGNSSGVLPYTVVIDRDGRVAYVYRGQMNRDVFDEYVLPLLDKV